MALDFAREVQSVLYDLNAVEEDIKDRRAQIEVLQAELLDAQNEKGEFEQDSKEKDDRIAELEKELEALLAEQDSCLLYTSPSPRDATLSRMPSSA